jgi:hypothetical protein
MIDDGNEHGSATQLVAIHQKARMARIETVVAIVGLVAFRRALPGCAHAENLGGKRCRFSHDRQALNFFKASAGMIG